MQADSSEVTDLLHEIQQGNAAATDRLMMLVYQQLRKIASGVMRRERPGNSLQPTALVHEVYIRMVRTPIAAQNRAHFYAIAARSMRHILVDHARRKLALKRGKGEPRLELQPNAHLPDIPNDFLALHEAMEKLSGLDQRQAQILEMAYFAGNSIEELAGYFSVSERTVKRELQTGRLFLKHELESAGVRFL
jgi:RNA polymerase sigma-70 factor (ECF subfamily)